MIKREAIQKRKYERGAHLTLPSQGRQNTHISLIYLAQTTITVIKIKIKDSQIPNWP